MAEFNTIRATAGARTARIDEGLRAHMNKVYGTMSVGMIITALAAWAISGLAVTETGELSQLGVAIYASPLKWLIMFAPLIIFVAHIMFVAFIMLDMPPPASAIFGNASAIASPRDVHPLRIALFLLPRLLL